MAKLQMVQGLDVRQLKAGMQHTLSFDAGGSIVGYMSLEKEQYIQMTKGKKGHGFRLLDIFQWRGFVCAIDEALKKVGGHDDYKTIVKKYIAECDLAAIDRHVRNCVMKKMLDKKMKVVMALSPSFERVGCDFIGMAEELGLCTYLIGTDAAGGLEHDIEKLLKKL